MGTDAPRLVYLARDARRRGRRAAELEDEGFEIVQGRPGDGRALIEQVRPDGAVVDLPDVEESDVELIAWLERARPHRGRPCFVSNVPPRIREELAEALPGLRIVKGQVVEAVTAAFDGRDGIKVATEPAGQRMDDLLVV